MCEQELEGRAQVCSARFKYAVVPTFATSQQTLNFAQRLAKVLSRLISLFNATLPFKQDNPKLCPQGCFVYGRWRTT